MATDTFVKVGDIKGESRDSHHKDEIEVLAWAWGLSNPVALSSAGGRAKVGKTSFQDVSFTHLVDMASPNLMLSCASGKRHPEAKLTVRRPDPTTSEEFILISMKDVLVTSVQSTGTRGPEGLVEQVTLNFAKVDFEYRPQRADGTPEPGVHFSWDLKRNTKI